MIISLLTEMAPGLVAEEINRATNLRVTNPERKGAHVIVSIPEATDVELEKLSGGEFARFVVIDPNRPLPGHAAAP